jgi:hypothetical protein
MLVFEIQQYELHVTRYRVKAKTEAQAIARVFAGQAEPVDNSLEYIEVAEDFGLPADDHRELADELRDLGIQVDEVIPSIRKIEQV